MKTNMTTTTGREYYTVESDGIWHAHYRPLNPKTGRPWQASRRIVEGWNVWRGSNWKTGTKSGIVSGNPPALEVWSKDWTGIQTGFATEAEALAAIATEQERAGK